MNTIKKNQNQLPVNALLNSFLSDDFFNWPAKRHETSRGNMPAVNISESENGFSVDVAAPGMKKEDFNVQVEENVLTVSAENKVEKEETKENFVRREFGYSTFKRSFILPEKEIDEEAITASYENGVLSLQLPKKEEAKPQPAKQIEIS